MLIVVGTVDGVRSDLFWQPMPLNMSPTWLSFFSCLWQMA